jgi:aromatic-L-amino-acid decarboxylase
VDGAYGGMAALLPERRAVLAGVERADSLVVNPHKWLFTPVDCSAFYTRDPAAVRGTFSLVPEYLRTGEGEPMAGYPAHNLMDYGIALGRRLRALKLWMVLNTFGLEGLRARLREHIRLAQWLAAQIDADPDFERLAPTPLSVVCFRCRPRAPKPGASGATLPSMTVMGGAEAPGEPDRDGEARLTALNQALLERLNASGRLFLSHTVLEGRYALRVAIGNIRTDQVMIEAAWAAIRETAAELAREGMTESG